MTHPARLLRAGAVIASLLLATQAFGKSERTSPERPEAASRTYAQNYKDMVLAFCISKAYSSEPKASKDASASASGLDEFGSYDLDASTDEILKLVEKYLAREYHSIQGPEVKLDLMKCFDMYHSAELERQVSRFVGKTKRRTYNLEHPPGK